MSLDPNEVSIVHWFPDLEKHRCGYCKNENGSISHGLWAESITVEDYQNLIDRGWRRSGKFCYKPIMNETCCPQYTIRCDSLKFKATKSQKKTIKKLNKYLKDGELQNTSSQQVDEDYESTNIFIKERPSMNIDYSKITGDIKNCDRLESNEIDGKTIVTDKTIPNMTTNVNRQVKNGNTSSQIIMPKINMQEQTLAKVTKKGVGADPNKPPCKKAKLLRIQKKQQKMLENGMSVEKNEAKISEEKSLQDFFNEVSDNDKLKLKTVLISTSEPAYDWELSKQIEFEVYKKYQTCVHNEPPEKCTIKSFVRFLAASPLKIVVLKMAEHVESYEETYKLYVKYQMSIHNDTEKDCDQSTYDDFLVESPLMAVKMANSTNVGYGSFHQQYWLNDKLIAVGVIDILPKCISSVYFFYDPEYRQVALGTYGSLREIQYTQTLHEIAPSIKYYYMGFYIHSCPKMRYKGKLTPSDLLCPETYSWCPIAQAIPKLEINKYSRLNEDIDAIDESHCRIEDINGMKVLLNYQFCTFKYYKFKTKHKEIFENIGKLVGRKCAKSMLIVSPRD